MWAAPSARPCHSARASFSEPPTYWMMKSTMQVVPPAAAAAVPVS